MSDVYTITVAVRLDGVPTHERMAVAASALSDTLDLLSEQSFDVVKASVDARERGRTT